MPIYEFYCQPCHAIFAFFARRPGVTRLPECPACGGALSREVSPFAVIGRHAADHGAEDDPFAGLDETRMEQAMNALSGEMGLLEDENADPAATARLFRKFAQMSGMHFKPEVREALARLEAGADPGVVEGEFSEALNDDNPFASAEVSALRTMLQRLRNEPRRDPVLRDLAP